MRGGLFLSRSIKAFAAEPEHPVGSGAVVFPGDGRSQLYKLGSRESLLELPAQIFAYPCGRDGEGIGQRQNQFLVAIEQVAFLIPIQVANLIIADSDCSASSGVDVDSKRALDLFRHSNLGELLQLGGNQMGFVERKAESRVRDKDIRMRGQRIQRSNVFF